MEKEKVLLTGISGFLGSHIAEHLSEKYSIIGLIRSSSDLWRYDEIANRNIQLVSYDSPSFEEILIGHKPSYLIHCAWGGVSASERNDWQIQLQNITFTFDILNTAKKAGVKQFIGLGSQAEYGIFSGDIDENLKCNPNSPYGACKLATLAIVESFCYQNEIEWQWLRIFPMYGTRESLTWFIPSVIKNALLNENMELTNCEQKYGYLYVKDFCEGIEKILNSKSNSGVYNFASNSAIQLRNIIEKIISKTKTTATFKIGALPYRPNQVMHMEGNSQKFYSTFDFFPRNDFDTNIDLLIQYYRHKLHKVE